MAQVKTLEAQRNNLQNTVIPAIERELARLREQKSSQEAEKNSLIKEREDNAAEVAVLDGEIEEEQKIISRINESISRSHSLYRDNIEREKPERENLLAQMSSEFIGVFA